MRARDVAVLVAAALAASCADDAGSPARVYVGSGLTDQVFVLDAAGGRILDSLWLDPRPGEMDEPHGLAMAPDGRHWYATVSHGEPTLWKFETDGDRRVGRLKLGLPGAGRVGISPDGRRAVVGDYWRTGQGADSRVALIDLLDLSEVASVTLCPAPHDAQFDAVGERIAVTCALGDEVAILDAGTLGVRHRVPVGPAPGPPGAPRYRPMNLVWTTDGDRVLVTLMATGEVVAIASDGSVAERASVGSMPTQLALAPGGASVVVVNRGDGSLSVLDAASLAELDRIPIPDAPHPHGIALSPDGRVAYVSFEGTVDGPGGAVAVDLERGRVLWRTRAGAYSLGIAVGALP